MGICINRSLFKRLINQGFRDGKTEKTEAGIGLVRYF